MSGMTPEQKAKKRAYDEEAQHLTRELRREMARDYDEQAGRTGSAEWERYYRSMAEWLRDETNWPVRGTRLRKDSRVPHVNGTIAALPKSGQKPDTA